MVLPAVVETALSRYKRPVLTIKLREHKKTAHRINIKFYMPTMVTRGRIEPTQNTGLQTVALPTELTFHMGAGILHYIKIMFYEVFKMSQKLSKEQMLNPVLAGLKHR